MFSLKKKYFLALFILLLAFLVTGAAKSLYAVNNLYRNNFFSYDRFEKSTYIIAKISYETPRGRALQYFSEYFINGMNLIKEGRAKEAKLKLLEAVKEWPEYYGTDFILALLCEDIGDKDSAARFYKSYLTKLDRLYNGDYNISEKIIFSLADGNVEEYDFARDMVMERLLGYGIELDKVRPAVVVPTFLFYFLVFILAGIIYVIFTNVYIPYAKKQRRIKNPPEGFWVCRHCQAESPMLSRFCVECLRPMEEEGQ